MQLGLTASMPSTVSTREPMAYRRHISQQQNVKLHDPQIPASLPGVAFVEIDKVPEPIRVRFSV